MWPFAAEVSPVIVPSIVKLLASAEERLETLEKYFNSKDTLNEGPTYTTTTT